MPVALSFAPLLAAAPAVPVHAFAAMAAFLLGLAQFLLAKGTPFHRALGYLWVTGMVVVTISSFWIHQIRQFGDFSVIHLLSIFVLIQLPLAVLAARRGQIDRHRKIMRGIFVGGLLIAGAFTFSPGRIMHSVLFGA